MSRVSFLLPLAMKVQTVKDLSACLCKEYSSSNLPPNSGEPEGSTIEYSVPEGQSTDTEDTECIPGCKLFGELNGTHLIFVGLAVTVVLLFLLRKMFRMLKSSRRLQRRRRSACNCSCRSRSRPRR